MKGSRLLSRRGRRASLARVVVVVSFCAGLGALPARASASATMTPGNVLVSTSTWQQDASITAGTTQLPPSCGTRAKNPCHTAVAAGTYPIVFNNDSVDGSFGVTQPILL